MPPFVFAVIFTFFYYFELLFWSFTQLGDDFHRLNFYYFRGTAPLTLAEKLRTLTLMAGHEHLNPRLSKVMKKRQDWGVEGGGAAGG